MGSSVENSQCISYYTCVVTSTPAESIATKIVSLTME